MTHYPDKPEAASDGTAFAKLCVRVIRELLGVEIVLLEDVQSQFDIGDSVETEFKELRNSHARLHIEVEERTEVGRSWVPAGIMRRDKCPGYTCGNDQHIFVFSKNALRKYREDNSPREVWYGKKSRLTDHATEDATIRSYVLPKEQAYRLAKYVFLFDDGKWRLAKG